MSQASERSLSHGPQQRAYTPPPQCRSVVLSVYANLAGEPILPKVAEINQEFNIEVWLEQERIQPPQNPRLGGQDHGKPGTLTNLTANLDGPVMSLDDPLNNR